jgi:hypothetical protein
MLVSNVTFTSSVRNISNTINYDCSGCGKRKAKDIAFADSYIKNIETDNQNLKDALRFACKIIAASE